MSLQEEDVDDDEVECLLANLINEVRYDTWILFNLAKMKSNLTKISCFLLTTEKINLDFEIYLLLTFPCLKPGKFDLPTW